MKKKITILMLLVFMFALTLPTIVMATNEKYDSELDSILIESKAISKKVLKLVKEGKEDVAINLPEVKKFKGKLEKNPKLAKKYLASLESTKTLEEDLKVTLDGDNSKIIEFDDGSFIQLSASTEVTEPIITPNDPGLIYHARDTYYVSYWGAYKVADLYLYTDYDYGNYYVKVTDANVTATVNSPAWLVSKTPTVVSSTRAKGDFIMQDPFGTFSVVLITDITPGPYTVTIKHTKL